jgi:SpoVK/Ycf46/Vps4 family AAA+-type ATPase
MNSAFENLAGLGALKAWLAKHLPLFRENHPLAPRAIVLVGLPGTGKHSVSKAIASALDRPLSEFDSLAALDPAKTLFVEDLGQEHLPLIRRHANPAEAPPFMIALTEQPWDLPAGLLRSDAIETIWHLDLPNVEERAEIWDLAAKRHGHENPEFDNVILARASHEFTPAEIHEAYRRAARVSHPRPPDETLLFDALIQLQPLVEARKEELLRLTYWTRRCARKASSE